MNERRGAASWSHDKGFDIEATDEIGNTIAILVCGEIALIPGETKRRVWQLEHESIEFGFGRQATGHPGA
jgi:hypothetical protein